MRSIIEEAFTLEVSTFRSKLGTCSSQSFVVYPMCLMLHMVLVP